MYWNKSSKKIFYLALLQVLFMFRMSVAYVQQVLYSAQINFKKN
jgi:hypothetical protein